MVNRALRILPLSILTACIFLGFGWALFGRVPGLETILSSVFLLPVPTSPTPIVLWTLKQELLFYSIFALSFVNARLGLGALALWTLASPFVHVPGSVGEWFFHPQNVQFGFGILASWLFVGRRWPTGALSWALLAIGAAGLLGFGYMRHASDFTNAQLAIPLGLCGFLVVVSAAHEITRIPRWLAFLGSASFSIYLIHFFFISMLNKVLNQVPFLPGPLALVLLSGFATAAGCIYYLLFEARLERLRKSFTRKQAAPDGKSGAGPL